MRIPLVDLAAQHRGLEEAIREGLREVLESGLFILGPAVERFEESMAKYHGVSHAVGVASGTDALLLALLAAGVGPGDEVITTPFTFVATAESIVHAGAAPVFADIDGDTYNLDPARVEELVTERTRAILPVHLYGLPADMNALRAVADRHGLAVIEDCAQSAGARIGDRPAGSLGTAAAFSFFPTKNLGGIGDGGMVLTSDATLAETTRKLRGHGSLVRDRYERLGFNSRLDSVQAGVLDVKLPFLDRWNAMRRRNAALYSGMLEGVAEVRVPKEPPGFTHVFNQYTVAARRRDELREHLASKGIGSMVYYSAPLHTQPVFASCGCRPGDFPVAEKACAEVLSLPVYPGLGEEQIAEVVGALREFFAS